MDFESSLENLVLPTDVQSVVAQSMSEFIYIGGIDPLVEYFCRLV